MAFAEEQANVLSFLLSDESSYMTANKIVIDGGSSVFVSSVQEA